MLTIVCNKYFSATSVASLMLHNKILEVSSISPQNVKIGTILQLKKKQL